MRRALRLARLGRGSTYPNPMVGCVLVSGGRVVGEGAHLRCGGPHAEPQALRAAGPAARGATAYVTMEPCCGHPGKRTPPCADALIKAKLARVVAAVRDPNPDVNGGGLTKLSKAGIKVAVGTLEKEARALNREFFDRMKRARPWIVLKTALSLDGRAAAVSGRSRWITGPAARAEAHRLRAACDGILVGVGTVLADDPALTSHGAGADPVRVVLDTRLRTPRGSRILRRGTPTWIFSSRRGRVPGAEVVVVPRGDGGVSLPHVLRILARRGLRRVLVEGGPRVHASFLAAGAVDEARVFLAPKLLSGASDPNRAPRLARPTVKRLGPDWLISGKL